MSKRGYQKHGLTTMKAALKHLGKRALDQRTSVAKELESWKREIISDLGGDESVSAQQRAVLELAVRTKLMLDSIDAWLLSQPSLVNKRRRQLYPVVKDRQQLADALARYMGQLGLDRKAKVVPTLNEFIKEQQGPES